MCLCVDSLQATLLVLVRAAAVNVELVAYAQQKTEQPCPSGWFCPNAHMALTDFECMLCSCVCDV